MGADGRSRPGKAHAGGVHDGGPLHRAAISAALLAGRRLLGLEERAKLIQCLLHSLQSLNNGLDVQIVERVGGEGHIQLAAPLLFLYE